MQSSIRKHISQMTKEEVNFIWKKLGAIGYTDWKTTAHFMERIYERGGGVLDVVDIIFNGTIIVYHKRNGNNRILIRGTKSFNGYVLCAVFEPESRKIITAYWNHKDDEHFTINMDAYVEQVDVKNLWEKIA